MLPAPISGLLESGTKFGVLVLVKSGLEFSELVASQPPLTVLPEMLPIP